MRGAVNAGVVTATEACGPEEGGAEEEEDGCGLQTEAGGGERRSGGSRRGRWQVVFAVPSFPL